MGAHGQGHTRVRALSRGHRRRVQARRGKKLGPHRPECRACVTNDVPFVRRASSCVNKTLANFDWQYAPIPVNDRSKLTSSKSIDPARWQVASYSSRVPPERVHQVASDEDVTRFAVRTVSNDPDVEAAKCPR